ncbi:MAG: 5-formyltetrahydrofolate cyclo-ligase [Pseudobutyrivibrio ruminis]|nr:5-formyltetrahydrofolate cyclo-ligase [Pseudobutyrivibrio ruminis]
MGKSQSSEELRLTYKKIRDDIPVDVRNKKSADITEKVLALLESDFKGANIFLCYYPFGSEVDLLPLYEELLLRGKKLYFPISDATSHRLSFYQIKDLVRDFHRGTYNIMEPNASVESLFIYSGEGICITPGLLFDTRFNRIGYGAGYYDRYLSDKDKLIKLAVCFDTHVIDSIPNKPHDVKMDIIVTENKMFRKERR